MVTERNPSESSSGWRGIGLIASTYIYFLIFAQYGYLKRLGELAIAGQNLKLALAAMAVSGVTVSVLVVRLENRVDPASRLRAGFMGCALGAMLCLLRLHPAGAAGVAALLGGSLGLLTVTLVTHLDEWVGRWEPLLVVACGVGLAYWICNLPPLFNAAPSVIAIGSTVDCLVGLALAKGGLARAQRRFHPGRKGIPPPYLVALIAFAALIWLDSAAFFIIQNTANLKTGTWGGTRVWRNGVLHFLAALGAFPLLRRCGLLTTLAVAFGFLGAACLCLNSPDEAGWASLLYPTGVSLYSVALVAYPALLAQNSSSVDRARKAGWLFALAGWIGSALGIGMVENLHRIPPGFVVLAALFAVGPALFPLVRTRLREMLSLAGLLLGAWLLQIALGPSQAGGASGSSGSLAARGRRVYISEGCLNCHSQFVRPVAADESMWGTPSNLALLRSERPPLIGNRRQGPDLANVGSRRSPLWLRAHFMEPAQVSYGSIMPSYRYLFADERGNALIAYVSSLGSSNRLASLQRQSTWSIPKPIWTHAKARDGAALLLKHCATCHAPDGATRRAWLAQFKRLPPNLASDPLLFVPGAAPGTWRLGQLARIIKFGLPGTDMPGHEYLSDEQVAALAKQVVALAKH